MFTTIQDSAVQQIQAFADKFLELCLQLSGAMHAYEEAFMTTPLLHASTSHSGDLAVLERLDNVLIGSIHMWWLHQVLVPASRDCLLRFRPLVQLCIIMLVISALGSSAASTTIWRCILPCRTQLGASQHRCHSTSASCISSFFLRVKCFAANSCCRLA